MDRHEWTDKTTGERWAAVAGAGLAPYGAAVASKAVGDEILRLAEEVERLKESRAAIARATGEAFREGEAKASARIRRELLEEVKAAVGRPTEFSGGEYGQGREHEREYLEAHMRDALDRIVPGEG